MRRDEIVMAISISMMLKARRGARDRDVLVDFVM